MVVVLFFRVVLCCFFVSGLFGTSVSDAQEYLDVCKKATTSEGVFATFKSDPKYTAILEHVTEQQGYDYLSIIQKKYPFLYKDINLFKINDKFGRPKTFQYPDIGAISPTTLRYIKIAGDLIEFIGDLNDKSIVEIGAGYGGQCLILNKIAKISNYYIYDLPEAMELQKKYLMRHKISNVIFNDGRNIQKEFSSDIVISNYAFSECIKEVQKTYLEKVIRNAKCGYMIMNRMPGTFLPHEIIHILKKFGFQVHKFSEEPETYEGNYLLIFKKFRK